MTTIDNTLFARAFDNELMFVIETLSMTGEPVKASSANLQRVLGYSSDDLSNNKILYDDLIHEDDIAHYLLESQQGALSDDCTQVQHSAYRLVHKDGYVVWVKDVAQIIREKGKVCSIVHLLCDITDEIGEKERIYDQKSRLIGVLHNAGFGLWEWDTNDQNVCCDQNWSHLLGFARPLEEIRLSRLFALIHPDEMLTFRQCVEDLATGKRRKYQGTVRVRHLSGKWRFHRCDGSSVANADNSGFLVTMSHNDVSDQKENELAAIAALSTRNQFFARVSHEIRTPLHGILGMLSLLKKELVHEKAEDKINKIIANSEHLLYLLNDILDLAKLNEAKLKISVELTSVTEVINQVSRLFDFKANEKDIKLVTELPPLQTDMVMTDKVRITQILSNLVSNAIKYTHQGSVRVFTKIEHQQLLLCIKDTGIGIKNTSTIFDAYNQEQGGYEQRSSSTGLGLEIVKKLCDLLGIEIRISSTTSGTTFQLVLGKPMPNTLVTAKIPDANMPTKFEFSELKVLIVDDSDVNREIVNELLTSLGALCEEVSDGYEAVKAVNADNAYDVVLMDKHMPRMNGIDATNQIRQNDMLSQQPVIIALTADAFDVDSEKWFNVGVDEIITKPFDLAILAKTIKRCRKGK